MNLIQEEHLLLTQVGEDGCQIALDLQRGSAGLLETDAKLVRDDGGKGRLSESGRTEEQHMIKRLTTALCRFQSDGELLLRLGLADELAQLRGPQLQLERRVLAHAAGAYQPLRIRVVRAAAQVEALLVHEVHSFAVYSLYGRRRRTNPCN